MFCFHKYEVTSVVKIASVHDYKDRYSGTLSCDSCKCSYDVEEVDDIIYSRKSYRKLKKAWEIKNAAELVYNKSFD